jgi:hypothetical protein
VTYEYGVIIRRQRHGRPAVWQFWIGEGCAHEASSFLGVMNHAGSLGFEAFAAGNFDELSVPEVLLKRALAAPPPPPIPAHDAGDPFAPAGKAPAAKPAKSAAKPSAKKAKAAKAKSGNG